MGSDQWCYDTMGAKQSKQNRSDNINQSQDISEFGNNGNTSTLPASFRRKGKVVSPTGSLPRNAGSQKFERSTGAGGSSIGKKFRKSCKNWAVQKGLVQKSSKSANAEPAGETKPVNHANEDNEKAEVVDDSKHEANIESLEQTEIIVKTNEDEKIEKVNNLQSRENLDDGVEIENDNYHFQF